jgi:Holliday junction resolvase RusA-like endonuclease
MPAEHRDWVNAAVLQFRAQSSGECWTGLVALALDVYMPRPKGRPPWIQPAAWKLGIAHPTPVKPDVDNLAKIIMDAMVSAGILEDDRFVCELHVTRQIHAVGDVPGVLVTVETWTPEAHGWPASSGIVG